MSNYNRIDLGYFDTEEQTGGAYTEAKRIYHTFNPEI